MRTLEPRRVILVDDSADDAAFVRRSLATSRPEVALVVFRDGRNALAGLDTLAGEGEGGGVPADLVLLDLKLPGLDGHAILSAIRERYAPAELPVVVFTSSREPSDVARAYAAGANSYVVKPLVFEEFLTCVELTTSYWLDANVRHRPLSPWQEHSARGRPDA